MRRIVYGYGLWMVLSALCLHVAGCAMPGEKKLVDVKGQYTGLANQRVAVLRRPAPAEPVPQSPAAG